MRDKPIRMNSWKPQLTDAQQVKVTQIRRELGGKHVKVHVPGAASRLLAVDIRGTSGWTRITLNGDGDVVQGYYQPPLKTAGGSDDAAA